MNLLYRVSLSDHQYIISRQIADRARAKFAAQVTWDTVARFMNLTRWYG